MISLNRIPVCFFVFLATFAGERAAGQSQLGVLQDRIIRGDSSRMRLEIRWTTPAVLIREQSRALSSVKAIEELRGKDPRPLLIYREAKTSRKKHDNRVERNLESEEIRLLTHWFHCVKLGRKVLDPKHRYHALFNGKRPARLLAITWDGSTSRMLFGSEKEKATLGALASITKLEYRKDPLVAIKRWIKLLDQWDKLDEQAEEYEEKLARAIEKLGERSGSARKWRSRLDAQPRQRTQLAKKEARLQELGLKHDPKARTHIDFEAEAAAAVEARSGKTELERLKRKLEDQKKKGKPGQGR